MRSPTELSRDELATLRILWRVYPDEILTRTTATIAGSCH